MPLEIKDRSTGDVKANGITGNTLRCGGCGYEILDDTVWIALDDPYYCLIHQTCLGQFKFDGMARSANSNGREKMNKELDDMQKQLHQMISRPWWKNNAGAKHYHRALVEMLLLHQSLRSSNVIPTAAAVVEKEKGPVNNVISREQLQSMIQ